MTCPAEDSVTCPIFHQPSRTRPSVVYYDFYNRLFTRSVVSARYTVTKMQWTGCIGASTPPPLTHQNGRPDTWPRGDWICVGRTNRVNSAAFSPRGNSAKTRRNIISYGKYECDLRLYRLRASSVPVTLATNRITILLCHACAAESIVANWWTLRAIDWNSENRKSRDKCNIAWTTIVLESQRWKIIQEWEYDKIINRRADSDDWWDRVRSWDLWGPEESIVPGLFATIYGFTLFFFFRIINFYKKNIRLRLTRSEMNWFNRLNKRLSSHMIGLGFNVKLVMLLSNKY